MEIIIIILLQQKINSLQQFAVFSDDLFISTCINQWFNMIFSMHREVFNNCMRYVAWLDKYFCSSIIARKNAFEHTEYSSCTLLFPDVLDGFVQELHCLTLTWRPFFTNYLIVDWSCVHIEVQSCFNQLKLKTVPPVWIIMNQPVEHTSVF